MNLEGKNALATGSDQGIRQAIAIRLAEDGANAVVTFRKNREETRRRRVAALGLIEIRYRYRIGWFRAATH